MPHIDVLPTSTSVVTPGYALVPDTRGLSHAAQPIAARKRAARGATFAGGDTTARQQNAVLKHLAELDKDSHRDVQIPVPSKQKENAGRAPAKKTTPNVRRILVSQKTFANHLADEEAANAQQVQNPQSSAATNLQRTSIAPTETSPDPAQSKTSTENLANEPLLKSYVPAAPSLEIMEVLTSAPPLPYNHARAVLSERPKPQRHFCEICGYWGTIKCLRCGARVCGLECKGTHDDGRCLKFYA